MPANSLRGNAAFNADRLWDDLMALAAITEPGKRYTRRSFSEKFLEGRRWIEARLVEAGMTVRYDPAVNLIARREGGVEGLAPIVIGSHSDTVPSGGRFDGTLGVLAGLEIVRSLAERGVTTRHPIEVIDFLAEEPSEYGMSCIGSRAMSGRLDEPLLALKRADGETIAQAIARIGGAPLEIAEARRKDIAAFLELHIEQGIVLESGALDVGIVTGIVGITRLRIVFIGAADHAGATPFGLRKDALVAAAHTVAAVRSVGEELSAQGRGYVIATTGCLEIQPNAANVVPGLASLVIEVRAEDVQLLAEFVERINVASLAAATTFRVERSEFVTLSNSKPSLCDHRLRSHLQDAAEVLGLSSTPMASGAGHDAAFLALIAPMAIVFVPSKDGKSHCPEEWTEKEQCADGGALLLDALLRIDRDPTFDHPLSANAVKD
ncbi:Zn-dependent hydrolase [Rhizobium rhizogenes]|uniref:Zn-dependent hydrolase n=1 Tax=Rhizobium rhizogenes TaxID=359 RepID=UPI0015726B3C|nr:Zn-dependent hydrolase [Rhizobium rhizogenes]NTH22884.1 Zn-dependent hydrolase [Rhizobium rhizogenes]NTH35913.1 Zn-dependent hydrolase [Rhizobium rhizogenes]